MSFYSVNSLILSSGKRTNTRQRYIFEITRENIDYCKKLIKKIELRHLDENEANFAVNERECLGFITMQKETLQATYSNMKEVVEQQQSVFETLWNKAIPARDKIMEIEQGLKSEFLEVISDHKKATEIYINLAKSVEREALILFANSKAIVRAKKFLRFELKEPKAEEFSDAIGFVLYSNSKVGAYSTRSFFELLWNEHLQYEKLKEADNMKNEFINVAAHELRTPIQPILSLSQVLQSKIKDTKQRELLDAIVRNAKRLQRLTNDILDVTKVESHSLNLNKEQFELSNVISNCISDIEDQDEKVRNGKLELFYEPSKQDIFVEADKVRISQVISNLLNNAVKFTEDGAVSIDVVVKENNNNGNNNGNIIIVSVKDSGEGIDPEIMPRLFSKFATNSEKGTGLGLFICKSIVEAHGGRVWTQSNNTGGERRTGATFCFSLPITDKSMNQQKQKHVDTKIMNQL